MRHQKKWRVTAALLAAALAASCVTGCSGGQEMRSVFLMVLQKKERKRI